MLKSLTISVCDLMSDVSFSNVSFTNVGVLVLGNRYSELRFHLGGFFLL